jgi:hypothetical protein
MALTPCLLVQPDARTCAPAALVTSRLLTRPAYAAWLDTGRHPTTGRVDPRSASQRFADEVAAMHHSTTACRDRRGEPQLAWPRALGTPPWAVAREMSARDGSGVPGSRYRVVVVDPRRRAVTWERVVTAVGAGHPVPLYVGNRLAPAHVVLVTAVRDGTVEVHDPATGRSHDVDRAAYVAGSLPFGKPSRPLHLAGAMTLPWCLVVPG